MNDCPHCRQKLTPANYEGFRVFHCERCGGHLVSSERFDSIKRLGQKTQEELKAEATVKFSASNATLVNCPRCRAPMRKMPIQLPVLAIDADVCPACALVWLDGGELALAQLGYETTAKFANAREMKRRMAELEASPERKAAFEKNVAKLPRSSGPVEQALGEIGTELLAAILRGFLPPRRW